MKEQNTLIEELNELKDPRRGQGKRHPLSMLILIAIMASMSGYHGYRATEDFIKANRDELIAVFEPKKDRLPSFQTIRRALMAIDFNEFSLKFYNWASTRIEIKENEWFSMDGKAIRGTIEGDKYHEFTNLVSLFSSENKKVLYAGKVDDKSNEIPMVQKMISELGLEGINITIDALHCQKKTTEIIIDSGNNYTIGVKENQPTLLNNIKDIISSEKDIDFTANIEKNRGRIELRETTVCDAPEFLAKEWKGIKRIIKVERTTRRKEKVSSEIAYFISSSKGDAEYFNRGIRLHWGIENSLHYIKDVTFGEDASQTKKDNSPENNSIIRNISINLFRDNGYESIASGIKLCCNKIFKLRDMIF